MYKSKGMRRRSGQKAKVMKKKKVATVSAVKKMLKQSSEYKLCHQVSRFTVKNYVTGATTSLSAGSSSAIMSHFPDQGDASFQRDGKQIKNVISQFKIKLRFYYNVLKTTDPVYNDQIPYHCWRVIVWCLKDKVPASIAVSDFFNYNTNTNLGTIDMASINRAKVTVLYDKVHTAVHTWVNTVFPLESVSSPMCKTKYITVKRRWKSLNFENNTTDVPNKVTADTVVTVLPVGIRASNTETIGEVIWRTTTYYTE